LEKHSLAGDGWKKVFALYYTSHLPFGKDSFVVAYGPRFHLYLPANLVECMGLA
jgi:hypothetical protein